MSGSAGPLHPNVPVPPDAVGMRLLGALAGRILGEITDEEKAEVLESVEQSNRELVDAVRSLDDTINAFGNLIHLWTRIMDEWSRCGGRSVASFQTVVRDVLSEEAEAGDEGENEDSGNEAYEADDEAEEKGTGAVIDADFRSVPPGRKKT